MAITMKELQYHLVPYEYDSRVSYDWPVGKELMVEMVQRFQQDQDAQVEIDIDAFIAYLDDDSVDAPASPELLDGADEAELALAIARNLPSMRGREEEVDNIIVKYARF